MRCSQFVEAGHRTARIGRALDRFFVSLAKTYRATLVVVLNYRWATVILAFGVFAASLSTVRMLNKEFVPPQDQSLFMMRLQTPPDSSMAYTDSKVAQAEDFLSKQPDVVRYFASIGGMGGGEINTGILFVTLKDKPFRQKNPTLGRARTQMEIMDQFRKELKIQDTKIVMQDLSTRGFSASRGFPVEFSIRGPDWEKLAEYSASIMKKMGETGIATGVVMITRKARLRICSRAKPPFTAYPCGRSVK